MGAKTFAERAKAIQKRYPHANRVDADREAMILELIELFKEQEAKKQSMGVQSGGGQNTQHASGAFIPTGIGLPTVDSLKPMFNNFGNRLPMWEDRQQFLPDYLMDDFKKDQYKSNDLLRRFEPSNNELPFGNDVLQSNIEQQTFADFDPKSNATEDKSMFDKKSVLNAASGLASAAGNALALGLTKNPKLIKPSAVTPTFQFRGFNTAPFEEELKNQAASDKYSLTQAGVDFDTTTAGLNKINDKYASATGQVLATGHQMDNKEMARGDETMNKAAYFNAAQMTEAKQDLAARQDTIDQKRLNYITALSDNISTIFKDEADKAYADELAPLYKMIAQMQYAQKNNIT